MAHFLSYTHLTTFSTSTNPGILVGNSPITKVVQFNEGLPKLGTSRFKCIEAKAKVEQEKGGGGSYPTPGTKPGSIVCAACDGNGAVACSQCKGTGVNSQDHFNGQFKAGGLCWLCRGKREILCGDCNGAGFIGGFMSTFDE